MTTKHTLTTVDIPGDWLAQWSAVIRATHATTRDEWRVPTDQALHVADGDVSIRVVPDNYQTDRDGRDFADQGTPPPVIPILTYDDYYDSADTEKLLRAAVEALDNLPSGMGWRHGEVLVSVRTYARPGKRSKVVASWVVARVGSRGLRYIDAPDVPVA